MTKLLLMYGRSRPTEEHLGRLKMLHLPSLGIYGNTHSLMQDRNSQEIAEMVIAWLDGVEN